VGYPLCWPNIIIGGWNTKMYIQLEEKTILEPCKNLMSGFHQKVLVLIFFKSYGGLKASNVLYVEDAKAG